LSWARVATRLCGPPGPQSARTTPRTLFGLSPGGVCPAAAVTSRPVRSCRTFSPLPTALCGAIQKDSPMGSLPLYVLVPKDGTKALTGGVFSVALSLGLPPVGVTHRRVLWSPDFPPAARRPRAATCLPQVHYTQKKLGTRVFFTHFPRLNAEKPFSGRLRSEKLAFRKQFSDFSCLVI